MRMDVPTDERELRMDVIPVAASPPPASPAATASRRSLPARSSSRRARRRPPSRLPPTPPPSRPRRPRRSTTPDASSASAWARASYARAVGEKASTPALAACALAADVSSSNDRSCSYSRWSSSFERLGDGSAPGELVAERARRYFAAAFLRSRSMATEPLDILGANVLCTRSSYS